MAELRDNNIEFYTQSPWAVGTFTSQKHINRMKKLHEEHPDEFKYFHDNEDGSICCKFPMKWVKVSYPKQISEEQKQKAGERFRQMRAVGKL